MARWIKVVANAGSPTFEEAQYVDVDKFSAVAVVRSGTDYFVQVYADPTAGTPAAKLNTGPFASAAAAEAFIVKLLQPFDTSVLL